MSTKVNKYGATPTLDISRYLGEAGKALRGVLLNADSDTNENTDVVITTGTLAVDATFEVYSTGLGQAYLYENPTCSSAGTTLSLLAVNREAQTVLAAVATYAPTVTSLASASTLWSGFTNGSKDNVFSRLAAGKVYLFRHTALADNTKVGIVAELAE